MRKTPKSTIILDVETVEKWLHYLSYFTTTLVFWNKDTEWPMNLIKDGIDEMYKDIENNLYDYKRSNENEHSKSS